MKEADRALFEREGLIVGVGFQKTGTSTLREALKILGYRVKDTSHRIIIPILRGDFIKILKRIKDFDAVEDTPWYMIYKELDQLVPNSKFILTLREEESWYKSVKNHIGDLRNADHEWIYGRGKGLPKDDKENTIRVYREHIREVREYFKDRPDDLLELNFTEGDQWEKLCKFLGKEIPKEDFPHYNKTDWKQESKANLKGFRLLRKRIRRNYRLIYISILNLWEYHEKTKERNKNLREEYGLK